MHALARFASRSLVLFAATLLGACAGKTDPAAAKFAVAPAPDSVPDRWVEIPDSAGPVSGVRLRMELPRDPVIVERRGVEIVLSATEVEEHLVAQLERSPHLTEKRAILERVRAVRRSGREVRLSASDPEFDSESVDFLVAALLEQGKGTVRRVGERRPFSSIRRQPIGGIHWRGRSFSQPGGPRFLKVVDLITWG